ncbi:MAG: ImmA/IrrE family metallo-endopeptidase [Bacillota bacterium]
MPRQLTRAEQEAQRVLARAKEEFQALEEDWHSYLLDVELLASLLFNLGVQQVPDLRVGGREYAAFLEASQGLIVVEANHHEHRRRFSVAHEVGHFVLHYLPRTGGDTYRCTPSDMERGSEPTGTGAGVTHGRQEWEANLFAAELLMPEQPVLAMYRVVGGSVSRLAKHFCVSPQAMEIRLKRLPLPFRPKR